MLALAGFLYAMQVVDESTFTRLGELDIDDPLDMKLDGLGAFEPCTPCSVGAWLSSTAVAPAEGHKALCGVMDLEHTWNWTTAVNAFLCPAQANCPDEAKADWQSGWICAGPCLVYWHKPAQSPILLLKPSKTFPWDLRDACVRPSYIQRSPGAFHSMRGRRSACLQVGMDHCRGKHRLGVHLPILRCAARMLLLLMKTYGDLWRSRRDLR
ncbi:unnamed protein product [Symbiodinium natans]|uniref:Uncharacterized protein n=1 Tax=Symbiodinium natans TaxID=878477 RepID=A0A812RVE5_9DINO|nr:unnamed protein product [Symbiodinium natans]